MGLYKIVRSKGYKNFMSKLYGWGASLVILGALFKITHITGADLMLMLGMTTEALIFFFSAFEPLHVEYNWALVYPELAVGSETDGKKGGKELPKGTITQQLDKMLEEVKVGPELIESLAIGMRNLSDNAKKLTGAADATAATDGYVASLTRAGESARNLTTQYDKTAATLEYTTELQAKSSELIVNGYKQIENTMKGYSETLNDSFKNYSASLNDSFKTYAETLNESLQYTLKYKEEVGKLSEEVDKLTQNVAQIGTVYGNMLAAMTLK